MKLQELPQYIAIELEESLAERFMDSQELYVRFLRKLAQSEDFVLLQQAAEAADWQEAERRAHNLKGVCANLGLTDLQQAFNQIVQLLRQHNYEQAADKLRQAQPLWSKTVAYIASLE